MDIFKKIKQIIYGILAIVISIITIRLLLKFVGANSYTPFVSFWMDFSDFFVLPWIGIAPNLTFFGNSVIEISAIISILFYGVIGFLLNNSISSLNEESSRSVLVSFVDSLFKIVEFVLGTRIILKLFGAISSLFVEFIYAFTDWIREPFTGLIKDFHFGMVTVEISTIIILVIVILMDIGVDELFRAIFKRTDHR